MDKRNCNIQQALFTGMLLIGLCISHASHSLIYRPVTGLLQACHGPVLFIALFIGLLQACHKPVYFTCFSQAPQSLIYRPITGLCILHAFHRLLTA